MANETGSKPRRLTALVLCWDLVVIEGDKVSVLFSYATPVACHIEGQGYFRTSTKHSVTTSRHINGWVRGASREMPQAWFDTLDFAAGEAVPS